MSMGCYVLLRQIHKQPLCQLHPARVIAGDAEFRDNASCSAQLQPLGKGPDQLDAAVWRRVTEHIVGLISPTVIEIKILMRFVHDAIRRVIKKKVIIILPPSTAAGLL